MNKKIEEMMNLMIKTMEETKSLPWDDGFIEVIKRGVPRNYVTGKPYRGFNLAFLAVCGGSKSNLFLTFKQTQGKKGHVNKGSHGLPVSFFSWYNKEKKRAAKEGDDESELVPFWKTYMVFRLEDTSLPIPVVKEREKSDDWNADVPAIDKFGSAYLKAVGLRYEVVNENSTAWFSKSQNTVHIAKKSLYHSATAWYGTLLHELVHSSMLGLNRKLSYDEEEIVAEFGSALLCAYFGIHKQKELENEAVYLASWSKKLRSNPEWLFHGAQRAQKAVDYLLEKAGLPSFSEKFADVDATQSENIVIGE